MSEFFPHMTDFLKLDQKTILIQIIKTKGSTPRDCDALMLVNESRSFGTIGGGSFEYDAVNKARNFIRDSKFKKFLFHYCLPIKFCNLFLLTNIYLLSIFLFV